MSKKSNPTLIGAFVVGAVALLALGVALFGGAQFFKPKSTVVAYFESSVKGLRVGSNVLFRGVRIGFVKEIQLLGDVRTFQPLVRVSLELTPGTWVLYKDGRRLSEDAAKMISGQQLVKAGLRARLGTESFVTGQLVVELDFLPDTKPVFRALTDERENEIPTVPSSVQEVVNRVQEFLERVDFERLQKNLQDALEGLNELANSKDAREALAGLNRFANSEATQELTANVNQTLAEVRTAVRDFDELVDTLDEDIGPAANELRAAVQKLDAALGAAEQTFDAVERQVSGDTGLEYELTSTLREVRDAARSLRGLTNYLEEHPESLLRGKRKP